MELNFIMNTKAENVISVDQRKVCPSHPGEILKGLYWRN
jgi:hypothetical protein